jgi:hypothetical protein
MVLVNFDLEHPFPTIVLRGLGRAWDLHAWAVFEGLELRPGEDAVVLRWRALAAENPWGDPSNRARGCTLRFTGLHALEVTARAPDAMAEDDHTLADVRRVTPEPGEFRERERWAPGEEFRLRFEFESGRAIEVGAAHAELVELS